MTKGMVLDRDMLRRIVARRKRTGADRWDEVWDGVYMIMPLPNDEHQDIVAELLITFREALGRGPRLRPGVNVSDRDRHWKRNYRGPDLVVFLEGTTAVNRDSYWLGGPDFAVEVVSKGDRSRAKLAFYAKVNVRELLLVDRFPWSLELYRNVGGAMELVGRSTIEEPSALASEVLPLSFALRPGEARPVIEVAERGGDRRWSA
jgi:Uma2 family endonuclease